MSTVYQDFRYALRGVVRNPLFSGFAALALALGIGANTAIYSVVNGVVLRGLPYRNAHEIVMIWEDATRRGGTDRVPVAPGNFLDWRDQAPAFSEVAALANASFRVSSLDEPLVPLTHRVSSNYFSLLGVEPYLGRTFGPDESAAGRDRVVVLSYGLWQRVFGGEVGILERTIRLDDIPYTVIGVLGAEFHSVHIFGTQPDLWVPLVLDGQEDNRSARSLAVFGRLGDGETLETARASMDVTAERLASQFPETNDGWRARVVPIQTEATGRVSTMLYVLAFAVGVVLLIACANVANLTLARSVGRAPELALRRALGASGFRLSRQLMIESLVLAALGGALGVALAGLALPFLVGLIPPGASVPFLSQVTLDGHVLLFTLFITMLTGIGFGLVPARRAFTNSLGEGIGAGGRLAGPGSKRLGRMLVVAEVTLSVVLTAAAGLMVQSFRNLKAVEPGFAAERILTLRNSLRGGEFDTARQRVRHFEELAARLAELPGVSGVSATSFVPPLNAFRATTFVVPGEEVEPGSEPTATVRALLPDYFSTMKIPVVSGRPIGSEDREDSAPVAVINQTLSRLYFPDRDPVGESLRIVSSPSPELAAFDGERRIVGVVGDVRTAGMDPTPLPVIYLPHRQAPVPIMNLVMHCNGDPTAVLRSAETTAWTMPGDTNVYGLEVLSERIDRFEWSSDVAALLLGGFAALALVLGAAGIYAVIAYTVVGRTRELGLRLALGARRASVVGMVVAEALGLGLLGVGLGVGVVLILARWVESLLYGVSPRDFGTLAAASAALLIVAVVASLAPAWRASRIDPIRALRQE